MSLAFHLSFSKSEGEDTTNPHWNQLCTLALEQLVRGRQFGECMSIADMNKLISGEVLDQPLKNVKELITVSIASPWFIQKLPEEEDKTCVKSLSPQFHQCHGLLLNNESVTWELLCNKSLVVSSGIALYRIQFATEIHDIKIAVNLECKTSDAAGRTPEQIFQSFVFKSMVDSKSTITIYHNPKEYRDDPDPLDDPRVLYQRKLNSVVEFPLANATRLSVLRCLETKRFNMARRIQLIMFLRGTFEDTRASSSVTTVFSIFAMIREVAAFM